MPVPSSCPVIPSQRYQHPTELASSTTVQAVTFHHAPTVLLSHPDATSTPQHWSRPPRCDLEPTTASQLLCRTPQRHQHLAVLSLPVSLREAVFHRIAAAPLHQEIVTTSPPSQFSLNSCDHTQQSLLSPPHWGIQKLKFEENCDL